MPSSAMLRRQALVGTEDSEEIFAPIITVTTIIKLGITLSVRRIVSSWMLRRVALIGTDVSEELKPPSSG
jgi:hypothetical protein